MLRNAITRVQAFPDYFKKKPPPEIGVMYYDVTIWLKVLAETDAKTVRAFSRTCNWAYALVDQNYKILPRFPVTFRLWIRPDKAICTVATANLGRIITRFDIEDEERASLEVQVIRQLAQQTQPSKFMKHISISRVELDYGLEKKAVLASRYIEVFRKLKANEYYCSALVDKVKDLGTGKPLLKVCITAPRPDSALYGMQLARELVHADGRHGNWTKLLHDVFTLKNCTQFALTTTVRCRSTVSTIMDLLRMFIGVPNSTAEVEVNFMKTGNELFKDTCQFVQDAMRANGLAEHYTLQKFSNVSCEGIVIKAVKGENCFWLSQWKDHPCDKDLVYLGNKVPR